MCGYLKKGIQTPMAQGRSTKIISMIKWIRTRRLSRKSSLAYIEVHVVVEVLAAHESSVVRAGRLDRGRSKPDLIKRALDLKAVN